MELQASKTICFSTIQLKLDGQKQSRNILYYYVKWCIDVTLHNVRQSEKANYHNQSGQHPGLALQHYNTAFSTVMDLELSVCYIYI